MGAAVEFSTVTEMFLRLCKKYSGTGKHIYRYKLAGKYIGLTYDEFFEKVELFAHALKFIGVKKGDKVAIISENRIEWPIADMAILSLGAVDVPMFPTLTSKQIEYILDKGDVAFIILSNMFQLNKVLKAVENLKGIKKIIMMNELNDIREKNLTDYSQMYEIGRRERDKHRNQFEEWLLEPKPSDLATIIFTSGTTGEPKGVMLTHSNFVSNIKGALNHFPVGEDDLLLSFLPLSHSFERTAGYYTAMSAGATIAFAESIETVAQNMMEVKPTLITTVPRLFERIYNTIMKNVEAGSATKKKIFNWAIRVGKEYVSARRLGVVSPILKMERSLADRLVFSKLKERTGGRIRFFVSGGAALPRELGEFFEAVGIMIIEGYGMTESSPVISANRVDDYKFGTVGKPLFNVQVKIAEDGEILTRGPHVMSGYYKDEEETRETIDRDGWLHTGDVGHFDSDGFIVITDRKKHLFVNSGGKNIAPQPIESLLQQSPFIDQIVLIGDRRKFNSALIVPDFEYLENFARNEGIHYNSKEELLSNDKIIAAVEKSINSLQKDLAKYEQVRKFRLLSKPFTIEDGDLTPTLKVKRRVVEKKYADLIESMYNQTI
jgi:long-chain acyl-CoA synthetase